MKDLVEDLQRMLNDNQYMNVHPILSAAANEIINLRAQLDAERMYPTLQRNAEPLILKVKYPYKELK